VVGPAVVVGLAVVVMSPGLTVDPTKTLCFLSVKSRFTNVGGASGVFSAIHLVILDTLPNTESYALFPQSPPCP